MRTYQNKLCCIIMFTGSINQLCLLYVTGFMGSLIIENKLYYMLLGPLIIVREQIYVTGLVH